MTVRQHRKKEKSVLYCIYCGIDKEKGHSDDCPLIKGIPRGVWGAMATSRDSEYNLSLGRATILLKVTKDARGESPLGPLDEKQKRRLAFEQVSFMIKRLISARIDYESKIKNPLSGWWYGVKIARLSKKLEDIEQFAKSFGISQGEIKIFSTEKTPLKNVEGAFVPASYQNLIPVYRNQKTKELIYFTIDDNLLKKLLRKNDDSWYDYFTGDE